MDGDRSELPGLSRDVAPIIAVVPMHDAARALAALVDATPAAVRPRRATVVWRAPGSWRVACVPLPAPDSFDPAWDVAVSHAAGETEASSRIDPAYPTKLILPLERHPDGHPAAAILEFDGRAGDAHTAAWSVMRGVLHQLAFAEPNKGGDAERNLDTIASAVGSLTGGGQDFFRAVFDNLPVGLWVKDPNDDFRYVLWSRTMEDLSGILAKDMIGQTDAEVSGQEEAAEERRQDRAAVDSGGISLQVGQPVASFGTRRVCEVVRVPLFDADGKPEAILGIVEDVTERQTAERALRESETRYALAAQAANDGLWEWNVSEGWCYFSPRWKNILGYAPEEFGVDPEDWMSHVLEDERAAFLEVMDEHLQGRTDQFVHEHRVRRADGTLRWVRVRGVAERDLDDKPVRVAGSMTDITREHESREKLHVAAFFDALTGLPNRAQFKDRIASAIDRAQRDPAARFAVLFLDFDRFKMINDGLGHDVGDGLLCSIGVRVRRVLDGRGLPARLGGDEFVVLLEDPTDVSRAKALADELVEALAAPHDIRSMPVTSTASAGVVMSAPRHTTPDDILRDADIAMYEAKNRGRNQVVMFDDRMSEIVIARHQLEFDLRRAVERDQFSLRYQPILDLETGRLTGFEALLRWEHPELGVIGPEQFVPLAEETGLIVPLGAWAIDEATSLYQTWQHEHRAIDLQMNINVSRRQLSDPMFPEMVRDALRHHGLPPRTLQAEITESDVIDTRTDLRPTLASLRAMGIRIAMDDFGTGLSSLGSLHELPLDTIKIDRRFVQRMDSARDFAAITGAIVTLARNLNLEVVAEGVETPEQLAQLTAMGCRLGQGYLFSTPMRPEEATRWVIERANGRRHAA
ncbi:MAG: putative bifunctional diguanylate cyclase/phosphodiesterase [Phycisphaerales bacterium]